MADLFIAPWNRQYGLSVALDDPLSFQFGLSIAFDDPLIPNYKLIPQTRILASYGPLPAH